MCAPKRGPCSSVLPRGLWQPSSPGIYPPKRADVRPVHIHKFSPVHLILFTIYKYEFPRPFKSTRLTLAISLLVFFLLQNVCSLMNVKCVYNSIELNLYIFVKY